MAVSATPDDEKYFHRNVSTEELEFALRLAPIASVQNRCNPFEKRDFKNGLVELCAQRGITYIPHSPVGGHHGHVRHLSTPSCGNYQRSMVCVALSHRARLVLAQGPAYHPDPGDE